MQSNERTLSCSDRQNYDGNAVRLSVWYRVDLLSVYGYADHWLLIMTSFRCSTFYCREIWRHLYYDCVIATSSCSRRTKLCAPNFLCFVDFLLLFPENIIQRHLSEKSAIIIRAFVRTLQFSVAYFAQVRCDMGFSLSICLLELM